jgi:molybdopterin converting factor small subunit
VSVEVLYFASLADRTGVRRETVDVIPGDDVATLWGRLCARHAGLADLGYRPMVACDREYVAWDRDLGGVGEVAFLPPVSGG